MTHTFKFIKNVFYDQKFALIHEWKRHPGTRLQMKDAWGLRRREVFVVSLPSITDGFVFSI